MEAKNATTFEANELLLDKAISGGLLIIKPSFDERYFQALIHDKSYI